jgi:CRISPR-associated protein Cmr4
MFEEKRMMFIYVETSLHMGCGSGLGTVDLPIQRERTTGYPIIQSSGLRGRIRAMASGNPKLTSEEFNVVFGPEAGDNASEYAGALSVGDARILLFPVRSLAGVFAWATSIDVLARFQRDASIVGLKLEWELPKDGPTGDKAWVGDDTLIVGSDVVLEEFSFTADKTHSEFVMKVGKSLAENLPQTPEYDYWKKTLPQKLCILPQNAFRDFVLYATEIQTHTKINPDTKTVATGALWTTESLPMDSLLYAPLMATKQRKSGVSMSAPQVMQKVINLDLRRMQLGGEETTGQGIVSLQFAGGK